MGTLRSLNLPLLLVTSAFGQSTAHLLASRMQSDLSAVDAKPTFASWVRAHPNEELQHARYGVEYESQGQWCESAIAHTRSPDGLEIVRFALFYPPPVNPGPLPPLPPKQDNSLAQRCRLLAFWYEVRNPPDLGNLARAAAKDLSALWGTPGTVPRLQRNMWGSADWDPLFTWQHRDKTIWIAADQEGPGGTARLLAFMRTSQVQPFGSALHDFPRSQPSIPEAAARIAALGPALTRPILQGSRDEIQSPPADPASPAVLNPLLDWLHHARRLTPERRAAALVLADFYVNQQGRLYLPGLRERLIPLGITFTPWCPGDTVYTHSLLHLTEQLDPTGKGGELARIAHFEFPCYFETKRDWRDGLIPYGERILRDFPSSQWAPYVHYVLARTYEAKLLLSYPDGLGGSDLDKGIPTSQRRRLRQAAITHLRAFMETKPIGPDLRLVWQETWKLLAGLPPPRISFGCGCE
jgi:hypothetical protein